MTERRLIRRLYKMMLIVKPRLKRRGFTVAIVYLDSCQQCPFDQGLGDLHFKLGCLQRSGVRDGGRPGCFRILFVDRLSRNGCFRLCRPVRLGRHRIKADPGAPPPTITAQFTIGKSIDLRMANFRKALFAPAGGAGT